MRFFILFAITVILSSKLSAQNQIKLNLSSTIFSTFGCGYERRVTDFWTTEASGSYTRLGFQFSNLDMKLLGGGIEVQQRHYFGKTFCALFLKGAFYKAVNSETVVAKGSTWSLGLVYGVKYNLDNSVGLEILAGASYHLSDYKGYLAGKPIIHPFIASGFFPKFRITAIYFFKQPMAPFAPKSVTPFDLNIQ